MEKHFLNGIKFALGFLLTMGVILGLVYAAGFHYPSEIVPGGFQNGIYWFNGSLGIGTSSPVRLLTLRDSYPVLRFEDIDANGAAGEINVNNIYGSIIIDSDAQNAAPGSYTSFQVDGVEKMRIDSNGYVGIGTITPSTKLHIENGDLMIRRFDTGKPLIYMDISPSIGMRIYASSSVCDTNAGGQIGSASGRYLCWQAY